MFNQASQSRGSKKMNLESLAISGFSGRFPKCLSVAEFEKALFAGVDLITDCHDRWPYECMGLPCSMGMLGDYKYFDAGFFEINRKNAELLDPRGRKLLEVVFEAIVDAGFNPTDLRGAKTGVFLGLMCNLTDDFSSCHINKTGYMMANTISYTFDFHGPSMAIDTGCSSSITAMSQAVDSILAGSCDSAIVCAAQAHFLPYETQDFARLGVLNPEGRCKTFDEHRNGYVKSEAVVAVYLQKKENCRRIYGTLRGIGCNTDGYKMDGICHPSAGSQMSLIEDVHRKYNISVEDIVHVECHGTGTLVGDIIECNTLSKIYGRTNKMSPIRIGSVKSNIGHAEAVAGLVSLVKLLLIINNKMIPANLHYNTAAAEIPHLKDGSLKVVSENTTYTGGLLALNSYGLGGSNGYLVIEPFTVQPLLKNPKTPLNHRLVLVSGRTQKSIDKIMNKAKQHKNETFLSFIDNIFNSRIKHHDHRAYAILNDGKETVTKKQCTNQRPIWLSFSGMGSQWPGMGRDLMRFEVFRNTIRRCSEALKPFGVELDDLIINGSETKFHDPINCFTAIVAVEVAMTDLLFSLGIEPDGIIGHSLGEIGCAYADGVLTAQQAILVGYGRGYATKNTTLQPGLMAVVGMSAEECEKLLPNDLYIACDNCTTNVTISGPEKSVKTFTDKLASEKRFVKVVNTGNVAYHSKYINNAAALLLEFLRKVIPDRKLRSRRWLPSAVPEAEWGNDFSMYNSAEYHHLNFTSKVLFRQVLNKVPNNAVVIEVAPHGLLQAILRRGLDRGVEKLCLADKNCEDNERFFLEAVGRLFLAGGQPKLANFYGKTQYPVGPETPMISPLIDWVHRDIWPLPVYSSNRSFGKTVKIDLRNKEFSFLSTADGKTLLPIAWYIVQIWRSYSESIGKRMDKLPIQIKNLKLHQPKAQFQKQVIYIINFFKTGKFELSIAGSVMATGSIKVHTRNNAFESNYRNKSNIVNNKLTGKEIHKLFSVQGCTNEESTKLIEAIDLDEKTTRIKWTNDWCSFLQAALQATAFLENSFSSIAAEISTISVNPDSFHGATDVTLFYNDTFKSLTCPGMRLEKLTRTYLDQTEPSNKVKKTRYLFVPNNVSQTSDDFQFVVHNVLQIVLECHPEKHQLVLLERVDYTRYNDLENVLESRIPSKVSARFLLRKIQNVLAEGEPECDILVANSFELDGDFKHFFETMRDNTFVLIETTDAHLGQKLKEYSLETVFKRKLQAGATYILLKKRTLLVFQPLIVLKSKKDELSWADTLEKTLKNQKFRVILVHEGSYSGIIGYFNWLRVEYKTKNFQIFCIKDKVAEKFSLKTPFYRKQLEKGMPVNILKNYKWGTFREFPVEEMRTRRVSSCFGSFQNGALQWMQENPHRRKSLDVQVYYSSYDVRKNTCEAFSGNNSDPCVQYSGIDKQGKRIMGISTEMGLKTHLKSHDNFKWELPNNWSLKDAVTLPIPYSLACYSLFTRGNLHPGDLILIIASCSDIDLAIINLVQIVKCKVLVAVHSNTKYIEYLKTAFNSLKQNIFDASQENFQNALLMENERKNLDFVVNTVRNSESSEIAVEFLKTGATWINVATGTVPSLEIIQGLAAKNCTFLNVSLEGLLKEDKEISASIQKEIDLITNNDLIKPFRRQVIPVSEIDKFIEEQQGDLRAHNQHVVVEICDENKPLTNSNQFVAKSRIYFDPAKSHILISDLDALDLEIINWLVHRGARNLTFISTIDLTSGCQKYHRKKWQEMGCKIVNTCLDTTLQKNTRTLFKMSSELGVVGGIFDFSFLKTSEKQADVENVTYRRKLKFLKAVDIFSRNVCEHLEHFVVFTSSSNSRDSVMMKCFIRNLCEERNDDGLPALSMEWDCTKQQNTNKQTISSYLETLDHFLQQQQQDLYIARIELDNTEDGEAACSKHSFTNIVLDILGIENKNQINADAHFVDFGLDSLMYTEIKRVFSSHLGLDVGTNEIKCLTINKLNSLGN